MNNTVKAGLLTVAIVGLLSFSLVRTSKKAGNSKAEVVEVNKPQLEPNSSPFPLNTSEKMKIKQINLPEDRVVALVGVVSAETVGQATARIMELENTPGDIYLLINSPGGSVIDGSQLITAIENSKHKVKTVCIELCASMAAMIFGYGEERIMLDRAVLMYHDAAGGSQGYVPHEKSMVDFVDRYAKKNFIYIAARSKIDQTQFLNMVSRNIWVDGEDAQKMGLADAVGALHAKGSLLSSLKDPSERGSRLRSIIGM